MKTIKGNFVNQEVEAEELINYLGQSVILHGSIYKIRKMSEFSFVILRTKRMLVQCIFKESEKLSISMLKEEACVKVTADVVSEERSRTGFELHIKEVLVLSMPMEELPIVIHNKVLNTSIENLLDYRPITLRNEKERAIFKLQEGICNGFRTFLQNHKFTEIHTPKIVYQGAEGGANIFRLDYFGKEAYLAQSPQFYKQMMVGVFERVYEIAPVFRAEKHDTSRHLNEYTSVDIEMGYINSFEEIMEVETKMLQYTLGYLKEEYEKELGFFTDSVLPTSREIPCIPFYEAKELIARIYQRNIMDYNDFEPEEEKLLYEIMLKETGSEFVFVTHYPSKKRPFYAMDSKENKEVTLSFDLLFRGLEITTGGQRIHDYIEQVEKMERRGMEIESFHSFLMMHKYGMPPHGGFGLGLERFTSKLLFQNNVRLATLFPRDIKRLIP